MAYTVIATRYRPRLFDDLVGQEYVARTLKNAIASDRVAHAFLFIGVRGVGKTSAARILAKSINCSGRAAEDPNPCLECASCKGIDSGAALDVTEIDGASNNSVEDVRRLREQVAYRPTAGKCRVYIIDEVHMLSTSAFNALLKTLEEPPDHVKFILATTEHRKIPPTVLSRCQRFDFKPIGAGRITDRMRWILEQEKIEAQPGALELLAEAAEGSMRDGLSLLDKMASAFGSPLAEKEVRNALGLVERALLLKAAGAALGKDVEGCLEAARSVYEEGYDLKLFCRALSGSFRDLMILKASNHPSSHLNYGDRDFETAQAIAQQTTLEEIDRAYHNFSARQHAISLDPLPRAALEMALVRLALIPPLVPIQELIDQAGALAAGGSGVAPKTASASSAATSAPTPPPTPKSYSIDPAHLNAMRRKESGADERPSIQYDGPGDQPELSDEERWERFLAFVDQSDPAIGTQLMQGRLAKIGEAEIFVKFRKNCAFGRLFEDSAKQEKFEELTEAYFRRRFRLHCKEVSEEDFESHNDEREKSAKREAQQVIEATMTDPGVKNALDAFDGQLAAIDIQRLNSE